MCGIGQKLLSLVTGRLEAQLTKKVIEGILRDQRDCIKEAYPDNDGGGGDGAL